ncbi:MAG: aminoglycoside phosphotransferase family protein [Calditrichia bacterium]
MEAQQKQYLNRLKEELSRFFNSEAFTLEPLHSGASVRRFLRLKFKKSLYFPQKEIVLMVIPGDRLEMADDYLNISYYLRRHNIPRPRIFEIRRDSGWLFLAPAAGFPLKDYIHNHPQELTDLLQRLTDFLIRMQQKARPENHCPAFRRFFDAEKYRYEFDFHVRQQLIESYWKHSLSEKEQQVFREFSEEISRFLDGKEPVFVHRDFQSSNIFFNPKNQKIPFQIIDFQDARSGSRIYDLVSLLWDSYLEVPQELRAGLLKHFYENQPAVQEQFSPEEYQKTVDYTVIQRKLHDAGAFVYTWFLLQNRSFLNYINPAVDMALEVMAHYPRLSTAGNLLQKIRENSNVQNSDIQT